MNEQYKPKPKLLEELPYDSVIVTYEGRLLPLEFSDVEISREDVDAFWTTVFYSAVKEHLEPRIVAEVLHDIEVFPAGYERGLGRVGVVLAANYEDDETNEVYRGVAVIVDCYNNDTITFETGAERRIPSQYSEYFKDFIKSTMGEYTALPEGLLDDTI